LEVSWRNIHHILYDCNYFSDYITLNELVCSVVFGILPNDCDTLAFIGQGHSSVRTHTHARSSSSCDGVLIIPTTTNVCLKQQYQQNSLNMSDTYSEDDRKPTAVEDREPRDVEKGEGGGGGVKLPPSATTTQSKRARSSSSRHKRSHKHSHKHKHHHRDKASRNNRTTNDGEDEKIAATDSQRAPFASKASNRRPAELVSLAEDTKPPYKPSKITRRMEEVDNEAIAKPRETLSYAPSLVARRPADAAVPKVPDENGKNHVRNRFLFFLIASCLIDIFSQWTRNCLPQLSVSSICHSRQQQQQQQQQCVPPLHPQQMKMLSIATRQEQM
jgi:hypothetical protein